MAFTLTIDGYDVTEYVRVAHDEGLDPQGDYFDPQFSGAAAFSEGESWAADSVGNREMVLPLFLSAASADALYQLVRDINARLYQGAQVAFQSSTATNPTYFLLERGKLQPQFEYWIDQANRVRATLTLWVRPYGSTATVRPIASVAASQGIFTFAATGVIGDTPAAAQFEVRVGSQVASSGRLIAWGFHPNASHSPVYGPSSANAVAATGATVIGASGAVGSQYVALPVSPTAGASGAALTIYPNPVAAHVGRHRVLAIGRSGLSAGIPLYAKDRYGAVLGATAVASQTDQSKWQVIDLGELNVPGRASGQEPVPTQYVEVYGGGASGNTINASPALHINRVVLLPIDYSVGMLRTGGAGAAALYAYDTFSRMTPGPLTNLETLPTSDSNQGWANLNNAASGYLGAPSGAQSGEIAAEFLGAATSYVLGQRYTLGSGALNGADIGALVSVRLRGPAPSYAAGSPAAVELVSKYRTNGWVSAKMAIGPSPHLAIITSTDGTATTLQASAALAASGLFTGQLHYLNITNVGGQATAYVSTSITGGAPITAVSASNAAITQNGCLGVGVQAGPQHIGTAYIALDNLFAFQMGPGASDIGPREFFRFESHPENRVVQGNASVYKADQTANFRGAPPKVPAVGSPGASGAGRCVVLTGEVDNFVGNDVADVVLGVVERFRYLR